MATTAKSDSYHHGDLRSALIATGLRLLAEKQGKISLREVARETGVSATAVYRHFPDKDALLGALAHAGYEKLFDAQDAAAKSKLGDDEAFRGVGQAYVHFAVANPDLFRLMTSYMPSSSDIESGAFVGDNRAGQLLRDYIATLMPGASDWERGVAAVQALALVHGLAQLILGGQIPNDPKLIDAAVDQFGSWRSC